LELSELKKPSDGDSSISDRTENIAHWESRLQDLGVRVASALVEMDDLDGASKFLSTLTPKHSAGNVNMQKALLYLCLGQVESARACVTTPDTNGSTGEDKPVILALAHMADADYATAVTIWEELIASAEAQGSNTRLALYKQNLAVALLYLGRMGDVSFTSLLEDAALVCLFIMCNLPSIIHC
jgi:hypothetical protein